MKNPQPARRLQYGITLLELIMFIVIVGVALAGIVTAINFNTQHSVDPIVKKQGLAIAESMLEEVMLQNFKDPDSTANEGSVRSDWDDIDDYAGYSSQPVTSIDDPGTTISDLSGYTVSVGVDATVSLNGIASGQTKLITVTVAWQGHQVVQLQGYRTNYTGS